MRFNRDDAKQLRYLDSTNTIFLRFVDNGGVSNYPTIAALTERLFLNPHDHKMAAKAGIDGSFTLKNGYGYRWYKTKGADIINSIRQEADTLAKRKMSFQRFKVPISVASCGKRRKLPTRYGISNPDDSHEVAWSMDDFICDENGKDLSNYVIHTTDRYYIGTDNLLYNYDTTMNDTDHSSCEVMDPVQKIAIKDGTIYILGSKQWERFDHWETVSGGGGGSSGSGSSGSGSYRVPVYAYYCKEYHSVFGAGDKSDIKIYPIHFNFRTDFIDEVISCGTVKKVGFDELFYVMLDPKLIDTVIGDMTADFYFITIKNSDGSGCLTVIGDDDRKQDAIDLKNVAKEFDIGDD